MYPWKDVVAFSHSIIFQCMYSVCIMISKRVTCWLVRIPGMALAGYEARRIVFSSQGSLIRACIDYESIVTRSVFLPRRVWYQGRISQVCILGPRRCHCQGSDQTPNIGRHLSRAIFISLYEPVVTVQSDLPCFHPIIHWQWLLCHWPARYHHQQYQALPIEIPESWSELSSNLHQRSVFTDRITVITSHLSIIYGRSRFFDRLDTLFGK